MREGLFVKQHAAKWAEWEDTEAVRPDDLAERFIGITDDLAYARTFYPHSKTTAYLNGLAAKLHLSLYKNKKEKSTRFVTFWKTELPLLFKTYERQLAYSLVFFGVFFLMGAFSARYDDQFVRLIMGDDYVNMTNDNIARGDPFGVYKQYDEGWMFFMIAMNNLKVAFVCFVMGVFFSVGTVLVLIQNGVMVGAFQYYFFSKGLGLESVLVIWIHGTLEISAIIIAGAAGLVLGNSFLFPKTYSRLLSVKRGAKDGLKILVGLVPIIVTAAFFEGFITRHTEMPAWLSVAILGASLAFVVWYVYFYPNWLFKKSNIQQA